MNPRGLGSSRRESVPPEAEHRLRLVMGLSETAPREVDRESTPRAGWDEFCAARHRLAVQLQRQSMLHGVRT
jgi:hypothetical protein